MTDAWKPADIPDDVWNLSLETMRQHHLHTSARNQREWDAHVLVAARAVLFDRATRPAAVEDGPGEWRTIDSAEVAKHVSIYMIEGEPQVYLKAFGVKLGSWHVDGRRGVAALQLSTLLNLDAPPSPTEGEAR